MLTGTTRDPAEVIADRAAGSGRGDGRKGRDQCSDGRLPTGVSAVGDCRVEAVCNDEFNMHGVLATTMPVGPVIMCNGPGTRAIGMNSGMNVFGQGNRANLTIGRAVQLVIRNIGGGRPGERRPGHARQSGQDQLLFCGG